MAQNSSLPQTITVSDTPSYHNNVLKDGAFARQKSQDEWEHVWKGQVIDNYSLSPATKIYARRRPCLGVPNDDDVWSRPIVLSFDGGGIRGLSSLLVVQRLMLYIKQKEMSQWPKAASSGASPQFSEERTQKEMEELRKLFPPPDSSKFNHSETADYLPCHYFDYIAGTSTAGLIATMLGRMWMSADRALPEFKELTRRVYGLRHRTKARAVKHALRFDKAQEHRIKDAVRHFFSDKESLLSDESRCKTIICSFEKGPGRGTKVPYLFRSYDKAGAELHGAHKPNLTDIMRATACSPYVSVSVRLGTRKFCDTGLSWPNPAGEVLREVNRRNSTEPEQNIDYQPIVLSIGGGYVGKVAAPPAPDSRTHHDRGNHTSKTTFNVNQSLSTISEDIHTYMQSNTDIQYHRLNVPLDLSEVSKTSVEDWEAELAAFQLHIEKATDTYLQQSQIIEELTELAEELVNLRRQKSRTARWEAFAFGVKYQCPIEHQCELKDKKLNQTQLVEHVRKSQNLADTIPDDDPAIKMLVNKGRTSSDKSL